MIINEFPSVPLPTRTDRRISNTTATLFAVVNTKAHYLGMRRTENHSLVLVL